MTRMDRLVRDGKAEGERYGHTFGRAHRLTRTAAIHCHACPKSVLVLPEDERPIQGLAATTRCERDGYELVGTEYQRSASYLDYPGGNFRAKS